jgi:hypothetical protein
MRPSLKAEALRAMHVQDWIDNKAMPNVAAKGGKRGKRSRSEKSLSPTTVGDYITLIKAVMNRAASMGYIERNPIANMPKPTANVRQDFLPADTWRKILALATDESIKDSEQIRRGHFIQLHC